MVDDDITNLTAGKNALSEKYRILTAPSGQKLFQIMEKVMPDLILLDVMMPNLDGWSVLRQIRQESRVPIVMLTARGEEQDELFGFELRSR